MSKELNKVLVGEILFYYQGLNKKLYHKLKYAINQKTGEKVYPKN